MAIQRITGTNSGLDVDALVKASMTTYQSKIDKETQNKKVLEYQQGQYKQIMSDATTFYDKYFDILKTGNLMSSSTYNTVSFTSSDSSNTLSDSSKVTAKGFAGADVGDYKVTTTQIASKATASFKAADLLSGSNLSVKVDGKAAASVAIVKADGEIDMATTVKNLNTALNTAGIDVTAKYSEFSDSIVLESGKMGESASFQAGVGASGTVSATPYTGQNAKGVITKGTKSYNFDQASNTLTLDNIQFSFKAKNETTNAVGPLADVADVTDGTTTGITTTTTTVTDGTKTTTTKKVEEPTTTTTTATTTDGKTTTKTTTITTGGATTITTETTADGITTKTAADGTKTTTSADGKTTKTAADGTITNLEPLANLDSLTTGTNGTTTTAEVVKKSANTSADKKTVSNIISTTTSGETTTTGGVKTTIPDKTTTTETRTQDGKSTTITTASDGTKRTITVDTTTGTATETLKDGTKNTYTPVSLTGSTNVTDLKDKIVSFVNDYNTLLSSINTKIYETRDKDYMPLTDTQKAAMSDTQITAWEKKAQTGLLRKDSDLQRITSAMKSAMSSVMSGSGSYLQSIGINPVKDYTDKNGMFTIDEGKLTTALEDNAGSVKDLFTRATSTTDKGGVLTQLATTLKSEFKTSTSSLSKKVGLTGTSTEYNNTLTKNIYNKKVLISDLNYSFTDKQTALYKKYSNLETALQNLNSQKASLSSMLGTS